MMVLLIDIGNSFISTCCINKKRFIRYSFKNKKSLSISEELKMLIRYYEKNNIKTNSAVICSVVPLLDKVFLEFFKKLKYDILFVNNITNKINLKTSIKEKKKIGSDRLVNAYYTIKKFAPPALIIDLGTATTLDYINEKNTYEGGIILPGIDISLNALNIYTAKLPKVSFKRTDKLISNTTNGAISSGFYWGYHCMIEGLIKKIKKVKNKNIKVILTGGYAKYFKKNNFINLIDRDLTMKGLYLIYETFRQKSK